MKFLKRFKIEIFPNSEFGQKFNQIPLEYSDFGIRLSIPINRKNYKDNKQNIESLIGRLHSYGVENLKIAILHYNDNIWKEVSEEEILDQDENKYLLSMMIDFSLLDFNP